MCDNFQCERCGVVDNIHATPQTSVGYECHSCKHGYWHDQFPRETWDFNIHGPVLNRQSPSDSGWPSFS